MATTLYVEARQCTACTHVGLNDSSDTLSVCTACTWSGDTPAEDCCPGCGTTGTMSAACPKCGESYVLMAESTLPCGAAPAPAAAGAPLPLAPSEAVKPVFLVLLTNRACFHTGSGDPINPVRIRKVLSAHASRERAELAKSELEEKFHEDFPGYRRYGDKPMTQWEIVELPLLATRAQTQADAAEPSDSARYRLLRRGQHWSVIDGAGNALRAEALDAAVNAVIAAQAPGARGDSDAQ